MYSENDIIARYYDASYTVKEDLQDIPFYLDLAKQYRGRVLEIGCGTGRVLLEIARAGISVDGIDNAPPMLDVLRQKLSGEEEDVRQRVSIQQGDMRNFDLQKQYDLVIIPFRALQHMYTVEDQIKALSCAREHLKETNGRLAFNVFFPDFTLLETDIGVEKAELEWKDPQHPERTVRRYFVRTAVNKLEQYFEGEFIFRIYEKEELVSEERAALKMSYYTYPHLLALFKMCGLFIHEEYGWFDRQPIELYQEMIFVLGASPQED